MMVKPEKAQTTKTTLRLPSQLWIAVQHRAIDEGIDLQDLVAKALEMYLAHKGGKRHAL